MGGPQGVGAASFTRAWTVSVGGQDKGRPESKAHWDHLGRPVGVVVGLGSGLG